MSVLRDVSPARALLVVALAAALVYAPRDALSLWRNARNGQATPRAQRELAPAFSVGILDPQAVIAAARYIPRNATYYAAAGPNAPERTADAIPYVLPWATFNLLPRRATPRIDEAQWVIMYGTDARTLGIRLHDVRSLGQGVSVGKQMR